MFNWLRDPHNRVRASVLFFWLSIVGWLGTHALLIILKPEGADNWVFHLLLALSWFAISFTMLNIVVTTDIRDQQEKES